MIDFTMVDLKEDAQIAQFVPILYYMEFRFLC